MKIAHLPFCYYPDPVGGTEVYVHGLVREQRAAGHEAFVIAAAKQAVAYVHDGIPVYRFRVDASVADVSELYAADASIDATGFMQRLAAESPDILHVHGYTRAVSKKIIAAVKSHGIPIVFTYHTPTATCMRGSLMLHGATICDGALNATRCAACMLQSHGVPRVAAEIAARMPAATGKRLPASKLATALRMRGLIELRHDGVRDFLSAADRVVAPSAWVADLLRRLNVPTWKIVRSGQGTAIPAVAAEPWRLPGPIRLVFFGRIDRAKGLDILLAAFASVPALNAELHVYGIVQPGDKYARSLWQRAEKDARVSWHDPVPSDVVFAELARYDVAVVPSQALETGPLAVLEAFAAGVPVIGSRLGGIAERVRHEIDGLLVEPRDTRAWAAALQRIVDDASVLPRLRSGVQPPRTMKQVAREMEAVYRDVLAK